MPYLLQLKQAGQGCDYTIECGTKIIGLTSPDWASAEAEARAIVSDYTGETKLAEAWLYEFARSDPLPLAAWYQELAEQKRQREQQCIEAQERREFERLKKKFG